MGREVPGPERRSIESLVDETEGAPSVTSRDPTSETGFGDGGRDEVEVRESGEGPGVLPSDRPNRIRPVTLKLWRSETTTHVLPQSRFVSFSGKVRGYRGKGVFGLWKTSVLRVKVQGST